MSVRLIAGLGNPGAEYEQTRHNAGFWLVDELARGQLRRESRFSGLACKCKIAGEDIWLLEPQTYMNRSGLSVAALARFFKIEPEQILVVHDELDLKPGTARLKQGGGNGGHNGLKDIQQHLSSPQFWRLRFGIGHPRDLPGNLARMDVADYVLKKPSSEEQEKLDAAITKAISILPLILKGNAQDAMQILHGPN